MKNLFTVKQSKIISFIALTISVIGLFLVINECNAQAVEEICRQGAIETNEELSYKLDKYHRDMGRLYKLGNATMLMTDLQLYRDKLEKRAIENEKLFDFCINYLYPDNPIYQKEKSKIKIKDGFRFRVLKPMIIEPTYHKYSLEDFQTHDVLRVPANAVFEIYDEAKDYKREKTIIENADIVIYSVTTNNRFSVKVSIVNRSITLSEEEILFLMEMGFLEEIKK